MIPAGEAAPAELRERLSLYEKCFKNTNLEKSNFWEETASVTGQVHLPVPHSALLPAFDPFQFSSTQLLFSLLPTDNFKVFPNVVQKPPDIRE